VLGSSCPRSELADELHTCLSALLTSEVRHAVEGGTDTLGVHGAGEDTRGVLGEVGLLCVNIVVGVDETRAISFLHRTV
jgi:hypothetical protein